MTEVANRLAWDEALAAVSPSVKSPVSVILLDCRNLKSINEARGHHIGDAVLRCLARAVVASVRNGDLVARLGGDEFGVLLRDADEAVTQAIVERIQAALERESEESGLEIRVALGSSTSRDPGLESALRRADTELLEAKRASGRSSARVA